MEIKKTEVPIYGLMLFFFCKPFLQTLQVPSWWTYRLIFTDCIWNSSSVHWHPWGIKHGHTGHPQNRRWQSEINAGWRNLLKNTHKQTMKEKLYKTPVRRTALSSNVLVAKSCMLSRTEVELELDLKSLFLI